MLTIGIIREGKNPPDHRVVLSPSQCRYLIDTFPVKIKVQPSKNRCFSDAKYEKEGIYLSSDVSDCDLLIGIKEVPVEDLMAEKRYLFFSHTIKKQPSNKKLLQAILRQNIELIDFELITDANNQRLIAFGEFAGMVGAHNALLTWGRRTKQFSLPRMYQLKDYQEAVESYKHIHWPPVKIVLTGTGRVGQGAASVLIDMGIRKTDAATFLNQSFDEPVFVQLKSEDYLLRKDGSKFNRAHFHRFPSEYIANFTLFTEMADIFINGYFLDVIVIKNTPNKKPFFLTEDNGSLKRHVIYSRSNDSNVIAEPSDIAKMWEERFKANNIDISNNSFPVIVSSKKGLEMQERIDRIMKL